MFDLECCMPFYSPDGGLSVSGSDSLYQQIPLLVPKDIPSQQDQSVIDLARSFIGEFGEDLLGSAKANAAYASISALNNPVKASDSMICKLVRPFLKQSKKRAFRGSAKIRSAYIKLKAEMSVESLDDGSGREMYIKKLASNMKMLANKSDGIFFKIRAFFFTNLRSINTESLKSNIRKLQYLTINSSTDAKISKAINRSLSKMIKKTGLTSDVMSLLPKSLLNEIEVELGNRLKSPQLDSAAIEGGSLVLPEFDSSFKSIMKAVKLTHLKSSGLTEGALKTIMKHMAAENNPSATGSIKTVCDGGTTRLQGYHFDPQGNGRFSAVKGCAVGTCHRGIKGDRQSEHLNNVYVQTAPDGTISIRHGAMHTSEQKRQFKSLILKLREKGGPLFNRSPCRIATTSMLDNIPFKGGERTMLEKQRSFLKSLNKDPDLDGISFVHTNYCTNGFAQRFSVIGQVVGKMAESRKINNRAFKQYREFAIKDMVRLGVPEGLRVEIKGLIEKNKLVEALVALKEHDASQMKTVLKILIQLQKQDRTVGRTQEHIMLHILNKKFEIVGDYNCKSGLDRTGSLHGLRIAIDTMYAKYKGDIVAIAKFEEELLDFDKRVDNLDIAFNTFISNKGSLAHWDSLIPEGCKYINKFRQLATYYMATIGQQVTLESNGLVGMKHGPRNGVGTHEIVADLCPNVAFSGDKFIRLQELRVSRGRITKRLVSKAMFDFDRGFSKLRAS